MASIKEKRQNLFKHKRRKWLKIHKLKPSPRRRLNAIYALEKNFEDLCKIN
ncbi:hypothetical protein NC651_010034 [Populus alba x Populus x berolinensis]|nr:hypothetical protein NC651_010034 [Populus alba x Populus x berolinensis]